MPTAATAPDPAPANVFISWSGERSRALALALRSWLEMAFQATRPWMSEQDIGPGKRWRDELGKQLETTGIGIVCICPENQNSTAIHFEAGAISRRLRDDTKLIPYCLGMKVTDLKWPLNDFQARAADERGTRDLVLAINSAMRSPLAAATTSAVFKKWWPDLRAAIEAIPAPRPAPRRRTDGEILEELLERIRGLERNLVPPAGDRVVVRRDLLPNIKNGAAVASGGEPSPTGPSRLFSPFDDKELDQAILAYLSEKPGK